MPAAGMRDDTETEASNGHATNIMDRKVFSTSMSAAAILLDKFSISEQGGGLDLENPGTSKSHVAELTNIQAQPNKHSISEISSLDYEASHEYILRIRQQPIAARACGFGDQARRVIDPPPILQMLVRDPKATPPELDTKMRNSFSVTHCKLWNAELDHGEEVMPEIRDCRPQRRLIGATVTSAFVGRDEFGVEGCFFPFPGLSCRTTGKYRLKFSLVEIPSKTKPGDRLPIKATVLSDVFEVFPAKTFPGQLPTASHKSPAPAPAPD